MNGNYIGRCVLHGGDNKGALVINDEKGIYTCFTHCGTGNLISVAKKVYVIFFLIWAIACISISTMLVESYKWQ